MLHHFVRVVCVFVCVATGALTGCATLGQPPVPPVPKGVRIICWEAGEQLFDLVAYDTTLPGSNDSEPFRVTFANGRSAWVRASSCLSAEMSPEELVAASRPAPVQMAPPVVTPVALAPVAPAPVVPVVTPVVVPPAPTPPVVAPVATTPPPPAK